MKILIIAPHADDETIGMGGTMARYAKEGHDVYVGVVTGYGDDAPHPLWPRSVWETVREEAKEAMGVLGVRELIFREIPAVTVADQPIWSLNKATGSLVNEVQPEVMYVPFPFDLHKDHREIFHSMSVAWRSSAEQGRKIREIYTYEVQSETHWNIPYVESGFLPNVYSDISDHLETKLRALACYKSQIKKAPDARSIEAIRALAVWRGSQIGVAAAEGFVVVRITR